MVPLSELYGAAITPPKMVDATYGMAKMLIEERIPGDFVECGVFAGAHIGAMAKAILETGATDRKVHLFDSFLGIPMSSEEDKDWMSGDPERRKLGPANISSGISARSLKTVQQNMKNWGIPEELLVYHVGWFCDTVPEAEIGPIALLRLDGDLYESTRVCLEHLYPKMSPGGWAICDDWTLDGCRKAVMPYLLAKENCPIYWRAA
jgi:O-methyltransferase